MNSTWTYDQAARAGTTPAFSEVLTDTMRQARPVLPAPHQVLAELKKTVLDISPLSKRSLVYHGGVTLWATLLGFLTGTLLGMAMAIGIVHSRAMDLSVMPWAVISQTIPIVALAPMIVVVSNKLGIASATGAEGDHLGLSELFPGAGQHAERAARRPTRCSWTC